MPKLKPSPVKVQAEIVQRNIESRAAYFCIRTDREFEAKTGISSSTYCRHRHAPRMWTLEQLIAVAMAFKVPLSWLMTDHSGEIKEV